MPQTQATRITLLQYQSMDNEFRLMRNNPVTNSAESKPFIAAEIAFLYPNDSALQAVLARAQEVPGQWIELPTTPKIIPHKWGRIVQ